MDANSGNTNSCGSPFFLFSENQQQIFKQTSALYVFAYKIEEGI